MHRYLSLIVALAKIGGQCYHKHKKMKGICKTPQNCSTVYEDIIKGQFPQRCGRSEPIVCCVESNIGKKSKEMCKKYENLTFVWRKEPTLLSGDEWSQENICPWENDGLPIIYGGEKAKLGEFPHMALIGYGRNEIKWQCGGTLISENFVLTAAHCLYSRHHGEPVMMRLGDLNFTDPTDDTYVQDILIKKTYKYPHYKYPATYHDIALFELEYPAKLSIYVKPACIYIEEDFPNVKQVIASGWGNTEKSQEGKNDYLFKVALDIYSKRNCSRFYRKSKNFPKGLYSNIQMCAGSFQYAKDTCSGDSGGPIQIYNKDVKCSYYIVGITSNGPQCGMRGIPSVYVRIYPYVEWIESIVWP